MKNKQYNNNLEDPYLDDPLESLGDLLVVGDQALAVAAPRGVELNDPHSIPVYNLKT